MGDTLPYVIGYLLVLIIALTFMLGLITVFLQYRFRRASENKIFCTILGSSGNRLDRMLPVEGDEIIYRKDGQDKRMFIRPDKTFNMSYPPSFPKLVQVTARSAVYGDNNPEPLDPFGRRPVITQKLLDSAEDERFARALVARAQSYSEEPLGMSGISKLPIMLYIGMGVVIILLVVVIYMVMQTNNITPTEVVPFNPIK